MAATFEFIGISTAFTVTQSDETGFISLIEFAKNNTMAHVQNGIIRIVQNGTLKLQINRDRMVPSQPTDAAAVSFLQTLLYA